MLVNMLVWGLIAGIIHFVVVGILYMNPVVAQVYKKAEGSPALRVWEDQKEYLIKMFAGTQIEIFILTGAYLYLRQLFSEPTSSSVALTLACILSATRVYPRLWTMWIQTTYPASLLIVEFINGTIGTFVVILSLWALSVL